MTAQGPQQRPQRTPVAHAAEAITLGIILGKPLGLKVGDWLAGLLAFVRARTVVTPWSPPGIRDGQHR